MSSVRKENAVIDETGEVVNLTMVDSISISISPDSRDVYLSLRSHGDNEVVAISITDCLDDLMMMLVEAQKEQLGINNIQ